MFLALHTEVKGKSKETRRKRRRGEPHEYVSRVQRDHEEGVDGWKAMTDMQKTYITLGSTPTNLHDDLRRKIITACVPIWAEVERIWEEIEEDQ